MTFLTGLKPKISCVKGFGLGERGTNFLETEKLKKKVFWEILQKKGILGDFTEKL